MIEDGVDQDVEAARRGDRPAVERLLRSVYPSVLALCRRMTGNDTDAADAAQEALIAIARWLPSFDGRSRVATWVYRVATNACLDELRRRRRRPEPRPDADLATAATALPAGPDLDARFDVEAALMRLPLDFRAAVVLRDLCALDYAEIAEVLDLPPGTVRSRIARGRAMLAGLLTGNPEPSADRPTKSP